MELKEVLNTLIEPAFKELPPKMTSDAARVYMLAIGLQESQFVHTVQMGGGPAHGYWQFERGGGVKGVLRHAASKDHAAAALHKRNIPITSQDAWDALAHDQVLAAIFARLLLWTSPKALALEENYAWEIYDKDLWRPGRPHPEFWPDNWALAMALVGGAAG